MQWYHLSVTYGWFSRNVDISGWFFKENFGGKFESFFFVLNHKYVGNLQSIGSRYFGISGIQKKAARRNVKLLMLWPMIKRFKTGQWMEEGNNLIPKMPGFWGS